MQDRITPDMAKQELARREAARAELAKRQSSKPGYQRFLEAQPESEKQMQNLEPFGGGGEPNRKAQIETASAVLPLAFPPLRAAKYIPEAGKLAQGIANVGGRIGQSAGIGAATNAAGGQDIGRGAIEGALLGTGAEAISPLLKGGKKIYDTGKSIVGDIKNIFTDARSNPQLEEHVSTAIPEANALLEHLGGGAKTKEEATKKLANKIQEGFGGRVEQAGQFFEHPLQQVGKNERLYEFTDPLITTRLDKEKDVINKLKDLKVGQLFDKFRAKPTFHNAHELQSEIGASIGDLKSNLNKTADDRETIAKLRSVRNQLKTDIMDFLKRRDLNSNENLAPMYQRGVDFYRENVEPYLSSKKLREITRGGAEVPKNIEKIFETPSTIKNPRTGEIKQAAQHKILEDLPQDAKDLILFNKIGASKHAGNADKLVNALLKAENEGFQSYFSPELKGAIKGIAQKSESDAAAKRAKELAHKIATENKNEATRKLQRAKHYALTGIFGGAGATGATYLAHKLFGGNQ